MAVLPALCVSAVRIITVRGGGEGPVHYRQPGGPPAGNTVLKEGEGVSPGCPPRTHILQVKKLRYGSHVTCLSSCDQHTAELGFMSFHNQSPHS